MTANKARYLSVPLLGSGRSKNKQPDQPRERLELASDTDDDESREGLQSPTVSDKQRFGYEETLIYGKYRKELGSFAKFQAKRRKKQDKADFGKVDKPKAPSSLLVISVLLHKVGNRILRAVGEDWIFLTLLGIIMGFLSFALDFAVEKIQGAKFILYQKVSFSLPLQYFCWVLFSLILIIFAAGFTHLVSPQAVGSGIPEMKTILRGVVLKEFLKFRTLIAKVVGLVCSLGSTLQVGKEGPFVHIASIVATLLSKLSSFKGIYENESRRTEMLAVACAVGVAGTYAAPIGGVLFSIEVTTTYFAVKNYWRGFFTAAVVSVVFRLLGIWCRYEETITTMFKTSLKSEYPFYPEELLAFAFIGVVSGLTASLFILLHRRIILFTRHHKQLSAFLQKNRFIYPGIATVLIASCTFPPGIGQYFAGELTHKRAIYDLFSNITWTKGQANDVDQQEILDHWKHPQTNIYISLGLFIFMQFWMSALSNTLPIPAGVFIPVFTIGAGIGRLVGEGMATWFPNGVKSGPTVHRIVPGGYAVVGAAAFSGGVTRTLSTCVMVFEVTGQISHVIPAVIAVLLSNAVANMLQPSFYDSIIRLKRLPYLPSIVSSKVDSWHVYVEDIMVKDVKHVSFGSTYQELKALLENTLFRTYPLVDSSESMILVGSVKRFELKRMLVEHLNQEQKVVPGSNHRTSQVSTPTPRVENVTTNKPESVGKFSVTKVDETAKSTEQPVYPPGDVHEAAPVLSIPKSASAGNLEDLSQQCSGFKPYHSLRLPLRSILKLTSGLGIPRSASQSDAERAAELNRSDQIGGTDSIAEDVPFILNRKNIQTLAKRVKLPPEPVKVKNLSSDEQVVWEHDQLCKQIDWEGCQIDPAPFQLVERTSLHKLHSLFSLLGLNHAYVTNIGRLVGVVSLKEVRHAIQGRLDEQAEKKKKHVPESQTTDDADSSDDSVFLEEPQELEIVESEKLDAYTLINSGNEKLSKSDENENEDSEKTSLV